jgi:hypothetical protein
MSLCGSVVLAWISTCKAYKVPGTVPFSEYSASVTRKDSGDGGMCYSKDVH